ncbi:hypothetical protein SDC9_25670 [bioreactor metagenome]|jgi:hypothetical protein|uniref:Uncharacterized protein n=1 Tax=bioreactor metagenome TaxID=1076179 RepID=A0A644ULJ1_9ZZZZ
MNPKLKIILFSILLSISLTSNSQPTPPQTHGNNVNTSPTQGAPIGTGTGLLLALGSIYTSIKVYQSRKEDRG